LGVAAGVSAQARGCGVSTDSNSTLGNLEFRPSDTIQSIF